MKVFITIFTCLSLLITNLAFACECDHSLVDENIELTYKNASTPSCHGVAHDSKSSEQNSDSKNEGGKKHECPLKACCCSALVFTAVSYSAPLFSPFMSSQLKLPEYLNHSSTAHVLGLLKPPTLS